MDGVELPRVSIDYASSKGRGNTQERLFGKEYRSFSLYYAPL
jgi:hypothetical protein